jgi:hypothetical protein
LDNYHELLGILKTIEVNQLEGLNKVLQNLNQATQDFLKEHDNDNNGTIDIFELQKNKQKLANDLDKENKLLGASKLERIVVLMKLLEKGINDYNQGKLDDKITLNEQKRKLI